MVAYASYTTSLVYNMLDLTVTSDVTFWGSGRRWCLNAKHKIQICFFLLIWIQKFFFSLFSYEPVQFVSCVLNRYMNFGVPSARYPSYPSWNHPPTHLREAPPHTRLGTQWWKCGTMFNTYASSRTQPAPIYTRSSFGRCGLPCYSCVQLPLSSAPSEISLRLFYFRVRLSSLRFFFLRNIPSSELDFDWRMIQINVSSLLQLISQT